MSSSFILKKDNILCNCPAASYTDRSDKLAYSNSADSYQTAPGEQSDRVYIICHPTKHFVKKHMNKLCSNFRTIVSVLVYGRQLIPVLSPRERVKMDRGINSRKEEREKKRMMIMQKQTITYPVFLTCCKYNRLLPPF